LTFNDLRRLPNVAPFEGVNPIRRHDPPRNSKELQRSASGAGRELISRGTLRASLGNTPKITMVAPPAVYGSRHRQRYIPISHRDVRFTPKIGHSSARAACPLWDIHDRCIPGRCRAKSAMPPMATIQV
jgi:hypothetical protein